MHAVLSRWSPGKRLALTANEASACFTFAAQRILREMYIHAMGGAACISDFSQQLLPLLRLVSSVPHRPLRHPLACPFHAQSFSISPLNLLPSLVLCPFHSLPLPFPALLSSLSRSLLIALTAAMTFASLTLFSSTVICCL